MATDIPAAAPGGDWATQTVDAIDRAVGTVRANTVDRLDTVARLLVYGLLAAIMGVVALVLLAIVAVRLLDIVLPVWAAHLLLGAIFTGAGLLAWSKRTPASARG